MSTADYEKLGAFYLGKEFDLETGKRKDALLLYDAKDLVTHAVCVGMTGSGKTGLCLSLLEEAAIDGIPAIVIDPKGDLANLLLTFPDLKPEDFLPWVNEDDARRKGLSKEDFASQQAAFWKKGLADWGQDGDRIRRLRASADFAVYTPGSSAGLPVSVLRTLAAPPAELLEEAELYRERVAGTATALLGLLGIAADPVQSREHVFLSTLIQHSWMAGQDLDLPTLIQRVQSPPFTRIGVMELESVYPAKDRFSLAMAFNNLVASPGFAAWLEGEPLHLGSMLYTPAGKPKIAIFSIAHLSDAERMFFVSLLLHETLAYVRSLSGTTSLRALLYMDEIAGYMPPVANPPSKQPLMTLMKQARAFGFGVVLATQNPVDIDYKGLSNAGTWFVGRLQTERDKARLLDGMEAAAANSSGHLDRAALDSILSRLGSRVFLMNNVHEDHPIVFETRWAMSYLRGPLTRQQLRTLKEVSRAVEVPPAMPAPAKAPIPHATGVPSPAPSTPGLPVVPPKSHGGLFAVKPKESASTARPVLSPEIPQYFLKTSAGTVLPGISYRPVLLGWAHVGFSDAKLGVDTTCSVTRVTTFGSGPVPIDWMQATDVEIAESDVEMEPASGARFLPLSPEAGKPKSYDLWKKGFAEALTRTAELTLFRSSAYKLVSSPEEGEREFRVRLAQFAREARDLAVEKLRDKFAPKLATLQERLRRAEQQLAVQRTQARESKLSTAVSFGAAILGAFTGRKTLGAGHVGRAGSAIRGVGRAARESGDVGRAEETVEAVQQLLHALDTEFQSEAAALEQRFDASVAELDTITVKPKKTGIDVRALVLAWQPGLCDAAGNFVPA